MDKAIIGCLMKFNYGTKEGRSAYKVGIISEVIDNQDKRYTLEGHQTCKYFKIYLNENEEIVISGEHVSSKKLDEREVFKLLSELRDSSDYSLSYDWLRKKENDLKDINCHKFTPEDEQLIRDRQLNNMQNNLNDRKRFLENKADMLEADNFHDFQQSRYNEIIQIREEVKHLKNQIEENKKKFNNGKDVFMEFNSVE